jgi:hypothetical protein
MHDHEHQHDEAGYEHEDLSSTGVYTFLIGLLLLGVVIQFAVAGTLHLFEKYNSRHQPYQNPLVQTQTKTRTVTPATIENFPQPRLEDSEVRELRDFREKEVQALSSYVADPTTGTTHIPIEQAMQLIVERGLPTKPQSGTTPPSIVDAVNQAAAKSDTSNKSASKKK